jgi:hypothetical protein
MHVSMCSVDNVLLCKGSADVLQVTDPLMTMMTTSSTAAVCCSKVCTDRSHYAHAAPSSYLHALCCHFISLSPSPPLSVCVCVCRVVSVDCGEVAASWLQNTLQTTDALRLSRQHVDDQRCLRHRDLEDDAASCLSVCMPMSCPSLSFKR